MSDDLGLFEERASERRDPRRDPRREPRRDPRRDRERARRDRDEAPRRKRKAKLWVFSLVALTVIGGGVWFGLRQLMGIGGFDDYSGAGETDVVVEVKEGDSTGGIATRLRDQGVVASTKAFTAAAEGQPKVKAIQPGFYVLRTKVSGQDAVAKIIDAKSRVGQLQIRAGTQFDDIKKADGTVTPGIFSLLSKASCAELNGKSTCVPAADLQKVAETADLAALGAPDWAIPDASKAADPKRRLEGLVMPSVYDVRPGSTGEQLWQAVVSNSSARLQSLGMPKLADDTGFTPYQVLVMASLIQREAIEADFGSVSRVTYNRLKASMPLQYDSTVNYVLDRPAILTKEEDREKAGAYNTYKNTGLTPTPIAAVSKEALTAAVKPVDGTWLYFVRCQKDGKSCFANTLDEHKANIRLAQANGAF